MSPLRAFILTSAAQKERSGMSTLGALLKQVAGGLEWYQGKQYRQIRTGRRSLVGGGHSFPIL